MPGSMQTRLNRVAARMRTIGLRLWVAIACCTVIWGSPESRPAKENGNEVFHYRMKGKVRLLFFWVGKDDVGGGSIAVNRSPGSLPGDFEEQVQVLFGSNPERVPGGINRWGFGRETAYWSQKDRPVLERTIFEGFMRHSKEESLAEVQKSQASELQNTSFLYDGIRSTVQRDGAVSELRVFSDSRDFDYRNATPLRCSYEKRVKGGPPDRTKRLAVADGGYESPFGFLTAIRSALGTVVAASRSGRRWTELRPQFDYVYNTNVYRLEIRDLAREKTLEVPVAADSEKVQVYRDLAKAEFRIRKLVTGETHDFTLWFPLGGELEGIPVRIVDKPRWWLRIELNLESHTAGVPNSQAEIDCSDE